MRLSAPLSDVGMAVEDMAMYYKPYIAAALPRDSLLQPRARFLFDARRSSIADQTMFGSAGSMLQAEKNDPPLAVQTVLQKSL